MLLCDANGRIHGRSDSVSYYLETPTVESYLVVDSTNKQYVGVNDEMIVFVQACDPDLNKPGIKSEYIGPDIKNGQLRPAKVRKLLNWSQNGLGSGSNVQTTPIIKR